MKSVAKPLLPALAVLLLLTVGASAATRFDMSATGISIRFFSDAGNLTHQVIAKHGAQSGNLRQLSGVEVHYFANNDPKVIVQKLEADDATLDDKKNTLAGHGRIVVATTENRLTGQGFDFALSTALLHIHRDFKMDNADVILTSERAVVELLLEKSGEDLKVRDVKRCDAIGNLHIVVQPTAAKEYHFKELFSEVAMYEGATRKVTLPKPSRTIQLDGGKGEFERMNFTLK